MTTEERRRRRFSKEFRKEQVKLIESGELTILEVSRLYEVKTASIKRWVNKFGSMQLPAPIIISSSSEVDRLRELEKEVKKLTQVIGTQQIKIVYYENLVELVKERLGEDFEKK